ncbi:ABC transporter substrate-binding protein [Leucobacter allii]|uniref:ABC transporter substrate-binding protein n=1 Tax=Leucobacter allii TaxID=2932247 RepID=A0ABY4FMA2_9MICO|nr:ABC transporter substrate-binding protein [Leucobacter allii]UOQ57381.1 ABC transporter substrate-binding protein [Leucobacter allii]
MKRAAMALIGAAAVALALTGCSPAASDAPEPAEGELQTVKVGAVPVVDVAALYVGENEGFFAEQGIELEIEFGQGSAAMIPALINGQYDLLYGGSVNLLQAVGQGLPLVATAVGGRSTGVVGEDHGGVLVPADSEIQSAADLEGRTVAVNALRGLHEVALWEAIRKDGGDPAQVDFVEMALPDMGAALEIGQIDAASTAEPFLGVLQGAGDRLVTSTYAEADPDFVTALYFTTEEKAESDRELIERFNTALEQSFDYAQEHPDAVRAELGNFTEIDPALVDGMILTDFTWGLTEGDLQLIADLAAAAESLDDPDGATERAAGFIAGE